MAEAPARSDATRWIGMLPVLVAIVSASLLFLWWRDRTAGDDRYVEARFQASARRVATKIAERLDAYDTILRGVSGLFSASETVTREEFHRYVDELHLDRTYPGMQGVGFAALVPREKLRSHVEAMRAAGFAGYEVRPPGDRAVYAVVTYLEPATGRNLRAFGYDFFTDPARREPAEVARDHGDTATSGRLTLVQETETDVQAGWISFEPVFARGADVSTVDGRRRGIVGWAFSPFRARDAMEGILKNELLQYRLEIFEGPPEGGKLLYESAPDSGETPRFSHLIRLPVNQRTWTLRFGAGPVYVAQARQHAPALDLILVTVLWVLLTALSAAAVASWRARQRALELSGSLAASEARWRATFEHAPVGILVVDAEDRYLRVNRRYAEITGFDPGELAGMRRGAVVHPDDAGVDADVARSVRSGERPVGTMERRGLRKDGSTFWAEVTLSLEPSAAGGPGTLIGVLEDVTARHEAEERFREIAEHAVTGILILQDDRVVYANPVTAELLARPLPELLTGGAELVAKVVHPDDRALVLADRDRQIREPERMAPVLGYRIVRPDGSVRRVERMVRTIRHGGRAATLMTLLDVTDRERTEEELRKAQRLESLGLVAGGIAHDFNNILTAVFGQVELARAEAGAQGPVTEELDVALSALSRARDLTRQLLTFATGGAPERRLLDVRRLLEEAVRLGLGGSAVRGRIEVEPGLPAIEADEGQMSQLLNNLLVNARQATEGAGEVTLRARRREIREGATEPLPPGAYVEIEVRDTGHGIAPEVLPRIFDPFFTTRPSGTGLGLATSYSIVRRHEGHLSVVSAPGQGATFTILLPAAKGALPEAPAETRAPAPSRPLRVLLMDDEPIVRKVGVKYLRRLGMETETASDGAEAVEAFRRGREAGNPFDLVILDLTVPGGMGGVQAVAAMRRIDPGVVAVACSGYFDAEVMAEPGRFGFAGILQKPYLAADLENVLHTVRARVG